MCFEEPEKTTCMLYNLKIRSITGHESINYCQIPTQSVFHHHYNTAIIVSYLSYARNGVKTLNLVGHLCNEQNLIPSMRNSAAVTSQLF